MNSSILNPHALKSMHKTALSTLTLLVVALLAGTAPALAQQQGQQQSQTPAYATEFKAALQIAEQAQALESTNPEQAAAQYAEAYTALAEAAQMAEEEDAVGNADQIRQMAAKVAYQAGMVLHNAGQSNASIEHFQWGLEIYPAFAQNRQGLNAAQSARQTGPVYEAAQALQTGSASEALELLNQVEPNADVYFYKALAYQQMGQPDQSLEFANMALEAGGNSATREGMLYLIIGEAQIALGNNSAARTSLQQAQTQGNAQTSARAQALLEQIGE